MVIDAAELEKRKHYIGASDVGIILGLNPWKTAAELWTDKTYGAKFKGNSATARGNRWEPRVIEDFEEWAECSVAQDIRFERHYEYDGVVVKFAANTDGVVREEGRELEHGAEFLFGEYVPKAVVEAKTASARAFESWGVPGTDEVPDTYLVQTYCQMWCSGATHAFVPVLCGFDFYVYNVPRPDEDALNDLIHKCAKWWVEHVTAGVRPEGPPVKVSVLSSIERAPDSTIALPAEAATIVADWLTAKEEKKAAGKREDELRATLIERLQGCEIGMLDGGHLSYLANKAGARSLKWNE